mgnify:CR=1 FL=1
MAKQKKIPARKVLPLFGSGRPLCWCGAPAAGLATESGELFYSTVCRAHRPSEERLQAESVARADAALALHFDKAGQRRGNDSHA